MYYLVMLLHITLVYMLVVLVWLLWLVNISHNNVAVDYSIKATLYGNTVKRKDVNYFLFDKIDIKLDHRDYSLVFQKMNSFYGKS